MSEVRKYKVGYFTQELPQNRFIIVNAYSAEDAWFQAEKEFARYMISQNGEMRPAHKPRSVEPYTEQGTNNER